ncbi:MAG: DUF3987 domain-containing protein [Clostridiales bacterium]|nr:DUF3987 domain-containing protein [Clostridiales bacterium]
MQTNTIRSSTADSLEAEKTNNGLPHGILTEAHLWDEILKKEIFEMPFLILPVIYKIHGQSYPKETSIVPFGTEYSVERAPTRDISSIRSDTTFWIASQLYHFECEIGSDPEIVHRVFEYDTQSALSCSKNKQLQDSKTLHYPYSAVLFLKPRIKQPDHLTCQIHLPAYSTKDPCKTSCNNYKTQNNTTMKTITYNVGSLKVQSYTIQQIAKEKLFILIPFTPLRFRPLLEKIEHQNYDIGSAKSELTNYFHEIILVLAEAVEEDYLSEANRKDILALLRKGMIRVFHKNNELLQEVIHMTAPILELERETIARLQATVKEKETTILELERETIARLQATVKEKDMEIKALTAHRDAEIEALTANKDAEIEALTANKDAEIEALTANKDAEIEALTANKDAEIEALTAKIFELENRTLHHKKNWKQRLRFLF